MAKPKRDDKAKNDGPLNGILRVAAQMMIEHRNAANSKALDAPVPPAVDCVALLDVIQAAQSLYSEFCPIARGA